MAATFPGANNVFVPDHEASGKMVVDFSRNPNKFAVNRYCQIVPVDKTIGYYLEMTVEEAGRIVNTDLSDIVWPDGNDAPTGADGTESHEFKGYRLERYAPSFRLGDMTIEQATWDIVARHAAIKAQQMMTGRTQLAMNLLQATTSYAASHTSAVASISGNSGRWDQSTTARQDIKRSLNYAAETILDDTLAAVELSDLILVMDTACAKAISECQEIVDHVKGSPEAWAQIRGDLPGRNAFYGLPDKLYGFDVVVEATRKVTSRKGATRVNAHVCDRTKPFMCARPGGLIGVADAPNFSTCVIFVHKMYEMAVEKWNDINNKRVVGLVIDCMVPKVVAPASGFLFTTAVA